MGRRAWELAWEGECMTIIYSSYAHIKECSGCSGRLMKY